MAQGTHHAVVVGIAHGEDLDSAAAIVWRAVEDAGIVPSASRPVIVFAETDPESQSVWDLTVGVEVRSPQGEDLFAVAEECLRGESPAMVVVHQKADAVAVALALAAPAVETYD